MAELLLNVAEKDALTERHLRLELAAKSAPDSVAAEIRKRLIQIGRTQSFADWRKVRELAADLDLPLRTIVNQVAKSDASEALELMWRFPDLAETVHGCCDDSRRMTSSAAPEAA